MKSILKCEEGHYTLNAVCEKCGKKAVTVVPLKYSPDDKYASYRRKVKEPSFKEKGLI